MVGRNSYQVYKAHRKDCLLYTSDAADDSLRVDLGGRRIIKKKFFQAEDGIRDRSPSRGLGDVYKRQHGNSNQLRWLSAGPERIRWLGCELLGSRAVSYTHLTLPTTPYV